MAPRDLRFAAAVRWTEVYEHAREMCTKNCMPDHLSTRCAFVVLVTARVLVGRPGRYRLAVHELTLESVEDPRVGDMPRAVPSDLDPLEFGPDRVVIDVEVWRHGVTGYQPTFVFPASMFAPAGLPELDVVLSITRSALRDLPSPPLEPKRPYAYVKLNGPYARVYAGRPAV